MDRKALRRAWDNTLENSTNSLPSPLNSLDDIIKEYDATCDSLIKNIPSPFGNWMGGMSYYPLVLTTLFGFGIAYKILGIRTKRKEEEHSPYTSLIVAPVIEELLFRALPAVVGWMVGGPVGAMIALAVSGIVFALGHLCYYEQGKMAALPIYLLLSFFLSHVYVHAGIFGSIGLHQLQNAVAFLIGYIKKKTEELSLEKTFLEFRDRVVGFKDKIVSFYRRLRRNVKTFYTSIKNKIEGIILKKDKHGKTDGYRIGSFGLKRLGTVYTFARSMDYQTAC